MQATISDGAPAFGVSGVPGISFREARDRIRAAVLNSGLDWPTGAITISLPPASALRHGCGLDLPIAVAILAAAGTLPASAGADRRCVFAAELGLDGQLRPVRGLVPVLQAAVAADGPVTAVIAPGNRPEACMVAGVTIAPCQSLRQVAAWLRGQHTGLPARNEPVTGPGEHAVACATLTYLAEPGDTTLGALLGVADPVEVLARIRSGTPGTIAASRTALGRWRTRLTRVPADAGLTAAQQKGIRLICPGDPEWPPQLDDLGAQRPYALWARGNDLRAVCGQAVSVVGSGPPLPTAPMSPPTSPQAWPGAAGPSSPAPHTASTPPPTTALSSLMAAPSRSWPAAPTSPTRAGTPPCSPPSPPAAPSSANTHPASRFPGPGS